MCSAIPQGAAIICRMVSKYAGASQSATIPVSQLMGVLAASAVPLEVFRIVPL
jgi:hypothetical protein